MLISRNKELSTLRSTLHYRDAQLEKLQLLLARMKPMQFETKSEKLDREVQQLGLLIDDLETPTIEAVAACAARAPRQEPVRRPLPEHLLHESIVHALDTACPYCGGAPMPHRPR